MCDIEISDIIEIEIFKSLHSNKFYTNNKN